MLEGLDNPLLYEYKSKHNSVSQESEEIRKSGANATCDSSTPENGEALTAPVLPFYIIELQEECFAFLSSFKRLNPTKEQQSSTVIDNLNGDGLNEESCQLN
jgi:hypothetical protein